MDKAQLAKDAVFAVPIYQDRDSPQERRNKDIVLETWRAFWSDDVDRGFANMAEDVHWWNSGHGPLGSNLHGHDEIRKARKSELDFFADIERTVIGFHAAGNTVIMEARAKAHLLDGTPYRNEACVVYELEDEKIVRVRHYVDTKKADAIAQMLERRAQQGA